MNTPQTKEKSARELALECLSQVVLKGRSLSELQTYLSGHQQAPLVREMVFGVCRWFFYFEHFSKTQLKKPLRKKDHDVLLVIYLGMYQLQFMSTSDHAAVNETVNLVFKIRKKWAKGLVNALLRTYAKQTTEVVLEDIDHSLSYPQWMVEKIKSDWPDNAESVYQYGNQKASIALRINAKKMTLDDYLNKLTQQSIDFECNEAMPAFLRLTQAQNVKELPGFEQGELYVQDGSAQMASQFLNAKDGMRVLDACAAPGGKSSHIAELANDVDIVAVEKEPKRIERLKENINRLGHEVSIVCGDAAEPKEWFSGEYFDRILIDAPCSASGIIRRHPDIKILRRADDIDQLAQLQMSILKALWPLLKKGGELLYCTCSIFKQENEDQVASFIEKNDDCSELTLSPFSGAQPRPFGLQVLPSSHGHDGFYYAKLIKH